LFPEKSAMHYWDGVQWVEWDGVLNVEIKNHNTDDRAYISPSHLLYVHESTDMTPVLATGAGAVAMEVNPGVAAKIEQMTLHLSAAGGAGNLTITIDKGAGAAYDTVILTLEMTTVEDYLWIPPRPVYLGATDHLDIAWANASSRTYGIEVHWSAH